MAVLHNIIGIAVVLASMHVMISKGLGEEGHLLEYWDVACNDDVLSLSCPSGYRIDVKQAMYGRTEDLCVEGQDNATFQETGSETCRLDVFDELSYECNDRSACAVRASRMELEDPCPGITKYIKVDFDCFEPRFRGLQCEGREIILECLGNNHVMSIEEVFYGRRDESTCSSESAVISANCSGSEHAFDVISGLCDYKRECPLYVEPSLLDEPCEDTLKYLDVSYTCLVCSNQAGNEDCEWWASIGECQENPKWMKAFCRMSCTNCQQSESCTDSDIDCGWWASFGECEANPDYMIEECPYACNECPPLDPTEPPYIPDNANKTVVCQNGRDTISCPDGEYLRVHYASFGREGNDTCPHEFIYTHDCPTEYFVTDRARFVCMGRQDCQLSARSSQFGNPCPGTHKYLSLHYSCQICENDFANRRTDGDEACYRYAGHGECEDNTVWMLDNCFEACTGCAYAECTNDFVDDEDLGRDVTCDLWALRNECVMNAGWMEENCQKSCRECPQFQPTRAEETLLTTSASSDGEATTMFATGETTEVPLEETTVTSLGDMTMPTTRSGLETTEEPSTSSSTTTATTTTTTPTASKATTPIPEYETDLACEGSYLSFTCTGSDVIFISDAFYGRWDWDTCRGRSQSVTVTECADDKAFDKMSALCGRRSQCTIDVQTRLLGDPCEEPTYKYANVTYQCVDGNYFPAQCGDGCGAHGQCVGHDICRCDDGYSGATCDEYSCTEAEDSCSGNGDCVSAGVCVCDEGWQGSDDCSRPSCTSVNDCGGRGRCIGPNTCFCYPYFEGEDCSSCSVQFGTLPACMPCPQCGPYGECVHDRVEAERPTHSYVGCYGDSESEADFEYLAWDGEPTSTFSCMQRCYQEGYAYAGLQNGQECHCTQSFGRYGEADNCDMPCNSGAAGDICGGYYAMSVWMVFEGQCQCDHGFAGAACEQCADGFSGPFCEPDENASTTSPTSPTIPTTSTTETTSASTESVTSTTLLIPTSTESSTTEGITTTSSSSTTTTTTSASTESAPTEGQSTTSTTTSTVSSSSERIHSTTTSTATTTTESTTSSTTTFPQRADAVTMSVIFELPWDDQYVDLIQDDTKALLSDIKRTLMDFYRSIFDDLIDVYILRLRKGSVVVEHQLIFGHPLNSTARQDYKCMVMDSLAEAGNELDNTKAEVDSEISENCAFCYHEGILHSDGDGTWYCQCDGDYKGSRCEEKKDPDLTIIIIVVVCVVVPVIMLVITCCCLRMRKNKANQRRLLQEEDEPGSAMNTFSTASGGARRVSSKKMFQSNTKDTVEVPRQI